MNPIRKNVKQTNEKMMNTLFEFIVLRLTKLKEHFLIALSGHMHLTIYLHR